MPARVIGFRVAFRVAARIIEPTNKADSLRVLAEAASAQPPYRTLTRRPRVFAADSGRGTLAAACSVRARLVRANLVLYDVAPCTSRPTLLRGVAQHWGRHGVEGLLRRGVSGARNRRPPGHGLAGEPRDAGPMPCDPEYRG